MLIAGAALAGNCLLNSPGRFSKEHDQDQSLLRPVVTLLALGGRFPTERGVEVRDLIFYVGAAALWLVAGFRLLTTGRPAGLPLEALLDFRRRASGPYFWWCVLLVVSAVSSLFSHAPEVCKGQSIIRFMHLAWWLPLAALLTPTHARRLAGYLLGLLAVLAVVALWYNLQRPQPRLRYPLGNELFLAACLLPAVFIAFGFVAERVRAAFVARADDAPGYRARRHADLLTVAASLVAAIAVLTAMYYTRSRSAAVGMAVGLLVMVLMLARKQSRPWLLLATMVLAIGGILALQNLRVAGVMGQRAHSIRARLDHEWPYALALFFQNPVAGRGDGAYAMLAGQMCREEQLEDPAILSFDEWSWVGHVHNEFLELLADLGFVGAFAFAAAIVLTVYYAMRRCERLRAGTADKTDRWLVLGLTGAFVALVIEECSDVALRQPGLPPIFLTVWAVLWAMVRSERRPPDLNAEGSAKPSVPFLQLSGAAACVMSVVLAMYAAQNWRAVRSYFEAVAQMNSGRFADAVDEADFAAAHTLDPFQNLIARMHAVWARSLQFDRILADSRAPLTEADLEIARQALIRLDKLKHLAPRFLRAARLEADLALNLSRAHEQRGESAWAWDYRRRFERALEQHRADEPFRFEAVADLWNAKTAAGALERIQWLRCLLRNGEIDAGFLGLSEDLASRDDFGAAMADLMNVAMQDAARRPDQWHDRLSPETFRMAALHRALFASQPLEGAKWAAQAEDMYVKAGPRLFAAHSAALHEIVRYRFEANPTEGTDDDLALLAKAQTIFAAPADLTTALPGGLGHTRLRVLLAAGREKEAKQQLAVLHAKEQRPVSDELAEGYLLIANEFADRAEYRSDVLRWSQRAAELAPESADAFGIMARVFLRQGDDQAAMNMTEEYLRREANAEIAGRFLSGLEARYPGSTIWTEIRRRRPGLLNTTTQPATGPAESEPQS